MSGGQALERCSHPGCEYIAYTVTNLHCQQVHGIPRKEVIKQYGPMIALAPRSDRMLQSKSSYMEAHKR